MERKGLGIYHLLPPANPIKVRGELGWEHVPVVIRQGKHIRDESERERRGGLVTPNPQDSQNQEVPASHQRPEGREIKVDRRSPHGGQAAQGLSS